MGTPVSPTNKTDHHDISEIIGAAESCHFCAKMQEGGSQFRLVLKASCICVLTRMTTSAFGG
jgi:hypothetical protein